MGGSPGSRAPRKFAPQVDALDGDATLATMPLARTLASVAVVASKGASETMRTCAGGERVRFAYKRAIW
jgi:hypothetical protein